MLPQRAEKILLHEPHVKSSLSSRTKKACSIDKSDEENFLKNQAQLCLCLPALATQSGHLCLQGSSDINIISCNHVKLRREENK